MTLIKSISGIRGTIGGTVGENLTPIDAVKFASAYGSWLKNETKVEHPTVVVGRDVVFNLVVLVVLVVFVVLFGFEESSTVEERVVEFLPAV